MKDIYILDRYSEEKDQEVVKIMIRLKVKKQTTEAEVCRENQQRQWPEFSTVDYLQSTDYLNLLTTISAK